MIATPEKKATRKKAIKTVKLVLGALWWVAVILLLLLMVNIITAKVRGNVPKIFGYSVMNIVSGSMEDEIPIGSYILIKEIRPEDVKEGDIICFYSSDPAIHGMPNTHRVVAPPLMTENGIEFVTRGDANLKEDSVTAKGDNLIGIYVKRMNSLTKFTDMLENGGMFILIVILLVCITTVMILTSVKNAFSTQAPREPTSHEKDEDKNET